MRGDQKILRLLLRELTPSLLLFTAQLALILLVGSLYQVERETILYTCGLCLLLWLGATALHVNRQLRDHAQRRQIRSTVAWDCARLPQPRTLTQQDDREMLEHLAAQVRTLTDQLQNQRRESLDYYTTWVHQIKTPIAALHMLLEEEDTEEHRAMAAELFRIEQYVNLALSFIRLDSETNDLSLQRCPLDPIIREAIHKYAPLMVRKRLRLRYEPPSVCVLTDEKWLLFILEQLLSNAVKYTNRGGITISVTEDQKLTISDTGMGIAPEDLPQIFEKGFTGYNGRADKKATGLGLYLCKRAAALLGVGISARSTVGEGSAFTLDLAQEPLEVE